MLSPGIRQRKRPNKPKLLPVTQVMNAELGTGIRRGVERGKEREGG